MTTKCSRVAGNYSHTKISGSTHSAIEGYIGCRQVAESRLPRAPTA